MRSFLFLISLLAITPAFAQRKADPVKFANTITADDLQRHLYIVAGKEMEGRETAAEGQRKAAAYIQQQFTALGLQPGNQGEYFQYFPVYQDSLLLATLSVNGTRYEAGKDFSIQLSLNNTAAYRVSDIVFAGYGITDSTRDDYRGLDVSGKIVLVLQGTAPGTQAPRRNWNPYMKQESAMRRGAIALFSISSNPGQLQKKGSMYVNAYRERQYPNAFTISENLARAIMGDDLAKAKSGELKSKTYPVELMLDFVKTTQTLQSSNVLGVLEGGDLKDQYVVITAHYDHLGKRDTVIYYGADDDGSGTVGVIELAQAFVQAKKEGRGPRRSILFMTVSGEEKGLWGSDYYSAHPVYPLDKTTVDLNIDMIGRSDPSRKKGDSLNYVYVVGDDKLSTDLRKISEEVNKRYTKLELDYRYNDPNDQEFIYYRSDHYNFAKKGVPIIFYFNGVHKDYHRPTDTPEKINYKLLEKRAKLVFYTAWDMANRNEMLKRDIPLDAPSFIR